MPTGVTNQATKKVKAMPPWSIGKYATFGGVIFFCRM
jgi:hypothetical protein